MALNYCKLKDSITPQIFNYITFNDVSYSKFASGHFKRLLNSTFAYKHTPLNPHLIMVFLKKKDGLNDDKDSYFYKYKSYYCEQPDIGIIYHIDEFNELYEVV